MTTQSGALLVVTVVATFAAGCTSSAKAPAGSRAAPTTRASTLNAAGIDPCKLLLEDAKSTLGIEDMTPSSSNAFDGATCVYVTKTRAQYMVTATDGLSLTGFAGQTKDAENTSIQLEGFPAIISVHADKADQCTVAIGTSDTGMIVVLDQDAQAGGGNKLCDDTRGVASSALKGLRAQQ